MNALYRDEQTAIAAWNTRAKSDALELCEEALEAVRAELILPNVDRKLAEQIDAALAKVRGHD